MALGVGRDVKHEEKWLDTEGMRESEKQSERGSTT